MTSDVCSKVLGAQDRSVLQPIKAIQIPGSIVVSISACHAEDRGSIPRQGAYLLLFQYFFWNNMYTPGGVSLNTPTCANPV